jgi:hypothetical protein
MFRLALLVVRMLHAILFIRTVRAGQRMRWNVLRQLPSWWSGRC